MRHMVFRLEVVELSDGWKVLVDAGDVGDAASAAPDCLTAVKMVVPFIAGASDCDPLEDLFRAPPAQDGPPQGATE